MRLTADTKIRLKQIKDLLTWRFTKDNKTDNQGNEHSSENGQFVSKGQESGEKHRSKKDNEEKELRPFVAKRDYAVKDETNPNESWTLAKGTEVTDVISFARGDGIDDIKRLTQQYTVNGKPTPNKDWQKVKGNGIIVKEGHRRLAEIHWYQCKNVGQVEHKRKRWLTHRKGQKK